jgi:hypothetical protein
MKLIETILDQMPLISKSQKVFFAKVIKMFLSIHGKINFRTLGRYSGLAEKTFRRWFKKSFGFAQFNTIALQQLKDFDEAVCALDACFLAKAGKLTYGLDLFWNGCASKVEKGIETSLFSIVNLKSKTAYALQAQQTLPMNEIKDKYGEDATRIDFYLATLRPLVEHIKTFTNIIVCDAFYTKQKFVDGVTGLGFAFIGKLRSDADLKIIFTGEQKVGPGRPRKFAGKVNLESLGDFKFEENIDPKTNLHAGIFYSQSLDKEIKVVAITDEKQKIPVALLFSTDLTLTAKKIYLSYVARFQIEFLFRDAQQFTGLNHFQTRGRESIDFHTNASFVAINIAKIEDRLAMLDQNKQYTFSMHNHKVRNHNETLISWFFSMLDFDLPLIKSGYSYKDIINYGINLNSNR